MPHRLTAFVLLALAGMAFALPTHAQSFNPLGGMQEVTASKGLAVPEAGSDDPVAQHGAYLVGLILALVALILG